MDTEDLERLLTKLAEMVHSIDKGILDMKTSIVALKLTVASQINPDDPAAGLERLHQLETVAREADPTREKVKSIGDVIDAIKVIQKHGSHQT